jgi:hypothetical protein
MYRLWRSYRPDSFASQTVSWVYAFRCCIDCKTLAARRAALRAGRNTARNPLSAGCLARTPVAHESMQHGRTAAESGVTIIAVVALPPAVRKAAIKHHFRSGHLHSRC